jgi:hypothetical protein
VPSHDRTHLNSSYRISKRPAGVKIRRQLTGSINVVLDATVNDLRMVGLPGTAPLALADGVVHLDPASAVFEAMLEGGPRSSVPGS